MRRVQRTPVTGPPVSAASVGSPRLPDGDTVCPDGHRRLAEILREQHGEEQQR